MSDAPTNPLTNEDAYRGAETSRDATTDHNALNFLVERVLGRAAVATLVRVKKVTNEPGDVKAIGRLDAKPLVNQLDGNGRPVEHKTVYGLPYTRYGGGGNAIIIDPEPDDVGLVVCADRDVSAVKRTEREANPASRRRFDLSDGVYVGLSLGQKEPKQYVRFTADGIEVRDKHGNVVLMDADGVRMTGPGGNKIRITADGIDLN